MLIDFTFENFKSFKSETTFSMISTRERKFGKRRSRLPAKYRMHVNPIAAVYGANASGKSSFVNALRNMQSIVIGSRKLADALPYDPFMLDDVSSAESTKYSLTYLYNEVVYTYDVEFSADRIYAESLYEHKSNNQVLIFERGVESGVRSEVKLSEFIGKAIRSANFSKTIPQALATSFGENEDPLMDSICSTYYWMDRLDFFAPSPLDSYMIDLIARNESNADWKDVLAPFDTGITGVERKEFSDPDVVGRDHPVWPAIKAAKPGQRLTFPDGKKLLSVEITEGGPVFSKLLLKHESETSSRALEWGQESDGTKQLFRLIPFFLILASTVEPRVVVIDEIDSSLHTMLSKALISGFLNSCGPANRSQLIFTSHDLMLMDLDMFRRDEIWLAEKGRYGASELIPLNEYEGLRSDSDLRRSYLDGRLGGISNPKFPNLGYQDGVEDE